MTITIGRVGRDLELAEPRTWRENADGTVSCSGTMQGASTAAARHLRDQLLGLASRSDELWVPVTLGHDDGRDGWYQVLGADVEHELGRTETVGDREWRVELQRSPWGDQPAVELHRGGTVLANDHSITTLSGSSPFVAIPNSAEAVDLGSSQTWLRGSRTSDTGALAFIYGSADLFSAIVTAHVPFADAYDGACKVEVPIGGTYRTVVGRSVHNTDRTSWRLNNGLIRAEWNTTNHGIDLEVYNGSAWETVPPSFLLTTAGVTGTAYADDPVAWSVIRNDPTAATVRCVLDWDSGTARLTLELTIRRGDRNVLCVLKGRETETYGIKPSTGEACTSITGAWRADTNDASGNRWLISTPESFTLNTSTGHGYIGSGTQFPFGIGVELDGSSATGQNTAANVRAQFYAQPYEAQRVSGV